MTRDEWAAQVADVVMEIAADAAAEAVEMATRHYTSVDRDRKKLRQSLIFLLSEQPQ
jgi:hypothetical protein